MTHVLVADCVSKAFGDRRVLSSASLRAARGELRVLLGRNGTGKSTLIKIAAGWIQPDSGTVHFNGVAQLDARLPSLAAQGLFYLPDHDLFSSAFTVWTQLEMLRRQYDGRDIAEVLTEVGLSRDVRVRPHALSGGERRRAELAAALVRRPTCLLADEPFRGMSPKDAEDMVRVFRRLAGEGTAVVITGHEVPTLFAAADHVTWSTAGTTYELGAPTAAAQHERFRSEYLGPGFAR